MRTQSTASPAPALSTENGSCATGKPTKAPGWRYAQIRENRIWIRGETTALVRALRALVGAIEDGTSDPALSEIFHRAIVKYRRSLDAEIARIGASEIAARLDRRAETPAEKATVERLKGNLLRKHIVYQGDHRKGKKRSPTPARAKPDASSSTDGIAAPAVPHIES